MSDKIKENKIIKKQILLFLSICLPVTWILTGLPMLFGEKNIQASPGWYALYVLACYMPAIAAVTTCVITKESIRDLMILPGFKGNIKAYLIAVFGALAISVFDIPMIVLLFFPEAGSWNMDITVPIVIFQFLLHIAVGCVQFYVLMGEEIGWMGCLFPKLEKLYGTGLALVVTGVIRGLWHMMMLIQDENFAEKLLLLCLTNIAGGCFLVLLTKMSGSVVPAAVCHALNNTLPEVMNRFLILNQDNYEKYEPWISKVSYIPYIILMGICGFILMKKYRVKGQ